MSDILKEFKEVLADSTVTPQKARNAFLKLVGRCREECVQSDPAKILKAAWLVVRNCSLDIILAVGLALSREVAEAIKEARAVDQGSEQAK